MEVIQNTKFFTGIEVEGKYKGLKTLFVIGDQCLSEIILLLDKNNFKQIYFGAYFQSKVKNLEAILYVVNNYDIIVTLEITYDDFIFLPGFIKDNKKIHKVVTFKNLNEKNLTFKIENDKGIYCYSIYESNSWNCYKEDKIIKI